MTNTQKLTADVGRDVVAYGGGLLDGSEQVVPLVGPRVAELRVVPHQHPAGTHLLQRAQTEPAEVLRPHHRQTVLTAEERVHMTVVNSLWRCGQIIPAHDDIRGRNLTACSQPGTKIGFCLYG